MKKKVLELRPTQFAIGVREVNQKTEKLKSLKSAELHEYLRERAVPIVIWSKMDFIIDHHHLAFACFAAGVEEIFVEMKADLSHLDEPKFWQHMKSLGWCHLFDQFGKPHEAKLLPEDVRGLADDPYRSLAWAVRHEGGYEKSGQLFSDFRWAEFLRKRVVIEHGDAGFAKAVKQGLALAKTPEARNLPGFDKA
jgi:hypothetical protein